MIAPIIGFIVKTSKTNDQLKSVPVIVPKNNRLRWKPSMQGGRTSSLIHARHRNKYAACTRAVPIMAAPVVGDTISASLRSYRALACTTALTKRSLRGAQSKQQLNTTRPGRGLAHATVQEGTEATVRQ